MSPGLGFTLSTPPTLPWNGKNPIIVHHELLLSLPSGDMKQGMAPASLVGEAAQVGRCLSGRKAVYAERGRVCWEVLPQEGI